MTINQALSKSIQKLQTNKIPTPHLDAEILLSYILKKPREYILARPEKQLTKIQITNYKLQITKRAKGKPAAYITGHKEFYGLDFFVNKNVLIPRPETELMVDEALKETEFLRLPCNRRNSVSPHIIDVGTGSGCIIITLAKLLAKKKKELGSGYPEPSSFFFLATDISKSALIIARKNAKLHNVDKKIKFLHGNLLEPIFNNPKYTNNPIIITANLPYGWNSWKNNCSMETIGLKFEPQIALFTENGGLKIIENLLKQLEQIINSRKVNFSPNLFALIEFDPRQTVVLKQLIKEILPNAKIQIRKDLAGLNRLVIITV